MYSRLLWRSLMRAKRRFSPESRVEASAWSVRGRRAAGAESQRVRDVRGHRSPLNLSYLTLDKITSIAVTQLTDILSPFHTAPSSRRHFRVAPNT
ncbi:hypothetical protein EVAR_15719_1 [Eumeta japonica]|uniref:Uncharacterized protein n=1 Tax=Eumeta variegata TaxID=151549 RepID=A0A4C1UAW2_EUMVA|nr:hypothetical protein EVAR_15719_1 [Eumeta japonica]